MAKSNIKTAFVILAPGLLLTASFLVFALIYWIVKTGYKKWWLQAAVILPLTIALFSDAYPAYHVSHRVDDGNYGMRTVEGNGVTLQWAPEGPGFPETGVSWEEARRRCAYLSEDGTYLDTIIHHYWRLPTADEAARSMMLHNVNCGGYYDPVTQKTHYKQRPDKETPLWKPHNMVIYWWTATAADTYHAMIIVYNGAVFPRDKRLRPGYLGFRAVRNLK